MRANDSESIKLHWLGLSIPALKVPYTLAHARGCSGLN